MKQHKREFKSGHCFLQCNHHCTIMISYNYRNNYRPINTSREYIKPTPKLDFSLQIMAMNAINLTFFDEYSNVFIRKWAIFPTTFWTKDSKPQTGVCNFKGVSVSINHLVTFPVAARYYLNLLRLSTHIFIFNWNNCLMDDSFSKIHGICSLIDGLITCRKYTLYQK